jgi:hypothetical protein
MPYEVMHRDCSWACLDCKWRRHPRPTLIYSGFIPYLSFRREGPSDRKQVHASSLTEAARRKPLDNNNIQDRAGGKSDQWSKDLGDAIFPQAGRAGKGCFWMELLIKTICQLFERFANLYMDQFCLSCLQERFAQSWMRKIGNRNQMSLDQG